MTNGKAQTVRRLRERKKHAVSQWIFPGPLAPEKPVRPSAAYYWMKRILGHTNASFTLDTYTHVTPDIQKAASGIVGGFLENLLGKELRPWQTGERAAPAP